jgi:hypothetical protein
LIKAIIGFHQQNRESSLQANTYLFTASRPIV